MKATLIDYMGSDLTVVNAARVSFNKRKDRVDESDIKLIHYLARHNHWTPFGHCQAQFHIKAPIFVARQLVKHQVGLVWNEVSRRYVDSEPAFHLPKAWRKRAENKKQGSSTDHVDELNMADHFHQEAVTRASLSYHHLLDMGVAPEQARIVLPLATYTEWYWTGSLAAWARIAKLRIHEDAQQETREVVEQISEEMADIFPVSWEALTNV